MTDPCRACGASGELTRRVLFDADIARACMACGDVRVFSIETVYSDNPHVDPEAKITELDLAPEIRAWVASFPRRSSHGENFFIAASVRAADAAALDEREREAEQHSALVRDGAIAERLLQAGAPTTAPNGVDYNLAPFVIVRQALVLSHEMPLSMIFACADPGSVAAPISVPIARVYLRTRRHVLAEIARSFDSFSVSAIAVAVDAVAEIAPAEDRTALDVAIVTKIARDPHSSDVAVLERLRKALRAL